MALWDPRSRAVHLVRDHMGIKPLYWTAFQDRVTANEEIVLFASEVRALLASGAVPRRLDPTAVASFLWHGFVVGPRTIVAGVQLLPAASVLTIEADDEGRQENRRTCVGTGTCPVRRIAGRARRQLRDELLASVKVQLVSDVPLGVFLSGGVDSSAVAALAARRPPAACTRSRSGST